MLRTVSETAKLAGVSVRTLHYYDEIGLLKPSQVTPAGYRYYDGGDLERLQQILFYRELAFSLKDIADILSRPDYDKRLALERHRELLRLKRRHVDDLLVLIDETIGGKPMKKDSEAIADLEAAKANCAAEVAEKWGKTSAYAEGEKRHAAFSGEQEAAIAEEAEGIFAAFAGLLGQDPADARAQELVENWQEHITRYHYPCTKEILSCLGQMYETDKRFTANLDRHGAGTALFMSEAIACYCRDYAI